MEVDQPSSSVKRTKRVRFWNVRLQTKDGKIMPVCSVYIFQSEVIHSMFMNLNPERCREFKEPIPVLVHSRIMKKIIEWCIYSRRLSPGDPNDPDEDKRAELENMDEEFLELPKNKLIEILLAADYLNIQPLIDILTQKIANLAGEKKSLKGMRKFFGLKKNEGAFPPPPENDKISWYWELADSDNSDGGVHGDDEMVPDHDHVWDVNDDEAQQGEQMEQ